LSTIGRSRTIKATLGEVPSDLILNIIMEGDLRKFSPKRDVLADMLQGELRAHVNFRDPTVVGHGLLDIPIFLLEIFYMSVAMLIGLCP
jgi:hypothetical protein